MTSEAQIALNAGYYIITRMDGFWFMVHPPDSWTARFLDETIFRTGFPDNTPESKIKEFYSERLSIPNSNILVMSLKGEL